MTFPSFLPNLDNSKNRHQYVGLGHLWPPDSVWCWVWCWDRMFWSSRIRSRATSRIFQRYSPRYITHANWFACYHLFEFCSWQRILAQLTGTTLGLALAGAIFQNLSIPRIQEVVPSFTSIQLNSLVTQISSSGSSFDLTAIQKELVLKAIVDASADTYVDLVDSSLSIFGW